MLQLMTLVTPPRGRWAGGWLRQRCARDGKRVVQAEVGLRQRGPDGPFERRGQRCQDFQDLAHMPIGGGETFYGRAVDMYTKLLVRNDMASKITVLSGVFCCPAITARMFNAPRFP